MLHDTGTWTPCKIIKFFGQQKTQGSVEWDKQICSKDFNVCINSCLLVILLNDIFLNVVIDMYGMLHSGWYETMKCEKLSVLFVAEYTA